MLHYASMPSSAPVLEPKASDSMPIRWSTDTNVDAEIERGKPREMADPLGRELVE
jgi:muramidase (phage lysozyme)